MATLYNADLKPLDNGVSTHPYQHATRLFLDDNYRLAPKQSFLYYVCINIDVGILQTIKGILNGNFSDATSSQSLIEQYETGLLVKKVDLPKFTMVTKTMNAYNRKNIIQTGITYEPITMSFHDDAADTVTTFWNDYYTYYYRDSDYDATLYQVPHKYQPRLREGWGYSPRNQNLKPFLRNIQIFSLHNKRFTEYLLVNPFITQWRHGEHNAYGDTSIMENNMTVSYEAVKYRTGYVNPVDVNGFATLHYDNTDSPISTSVTNIYSDAGLVGSIAGAAKDLARPDGTTGGAGVFGSLLGVYRTYQALKNLGKNGQSLLNATLGSLGVSILNGAANGLLNNIFVPTASGVPGYGGSYSGSQVAVPLLSSTYSPVSAPLTSSGITINGVFSSIASGIALNFNPTTNTSYTRGFSNTPPVSTYNPVLDVANNNGTVRINPASGQPDTGTVTYTSTIINADGTTAASFASKQTGNGSYIPGQADPSVNARLQEISTDPSGDTVITRTYLDGTIVKFDKNNQVIETIPGALYNPNASATVNTRSQAANGSQINPSQPQYYTDPRTGITYTVNGGTSGQITNAITGTAGAAAGLYAGYEINQGLNSTFLGKSVLGRTVSAGISGYAAKEIGLAVNNGLQPIVNKVTGEISQGFDSLTGKIKNVVGSWTGSGGYNPSRPNDNVASVITDDYGNKTTTYKNGTVVNTATDGTTSVYTPPDANQNSFSNFFNKSPGTNTDSAATVKGSTYGGYVTDRDGNPIKTGDGTYLTYGSVGQGISGTSGAMQGGFGSGQTDTPYTVNPIINISELPGPSITPAPVDTTAFDPSLDNAGFFNDGEIG